MRSHCHFDTGHPAKRVVCYLRMVNFIRKNEFMPTGPDTEHFDAIFRYILEHPKQPQSKRVEALLDLLSSLRDDISKLEKVQVISGLHNLLGNFRWSVQVSPTSEGFRAIYFPADRGHLSSADKWEYGAVRDLLELVPYLGKRPRIRRCAECEKWLFAAKRSDQQFCDGICRQKHYDSSPEMRESKKLYMREHRADEKRREESSKIGVRSGGRAALNGRRKMSR
jgi:hypothetical protein